MVFSVSEVIDMIIMSLAVGFIFSDMFGQYRHKITDPLKALQSNEKWKNFRFAIYVTAPAIILHEFGHKFTALAFGLQAEFHAAYTWLGLGILLKLLNFPFIFFVPAFVSISGQATAFQFAFTAFAGPLVNLVLWLGSSWVVKQKLISKKYHTAVLLMGKINMFLFIFNMLPFPGFDGLKVYQGLLAYF